MAFGFLLPACGTLLAARDEVKGRKSQTQTGPLSSPRKLLAKEEGAVLTVPSGRADKVFCEERKRKKAKYKAVPTSRKKVSVRGGMGFVFTFSPSTLALLKLSSSLSLPSLSLYQ